MDYNEKSLLLHKKHQGKIEIASKVPLETKDDLALAYTPGVAMPCIKISENKEDAYVYTAKGNTIAVISDGSAVLGLGNIGPLAAIPVMEGKALLLKKFANIDAIPICLDTQDTEEIIKTCKYLTPSFAAIHLEDISAPRCVEIERRLINELNIPVFHDDQHGTAIVVGAALINAAKLIKKPLNKMRVVLSGTGAAGSSIARTLKALGVKEINGFNRQGVVDMAKYDRYDFLVKELLDQKILTSPSQHDNSIASILKDADCFVGASAPNMVTAAMVKTMAKDAIVFAMANPTPEIMPSEARLGGARIIGTGRSDFPNQINNVLAFPGIFKGALEAKATKITEEMKLEASVAIASLVKDNELNEDYIIPSPFNPNVVPAVANAVKDIAIKQGLVRK